MPRSWFQSALDQESGLLHNMPFISLVVPAQGGYLAWKLTIDGKDIPYGLFIGEKDQELLTEIRDLLKRGGPVASGR
jgi:hypothetical protein